MITYQTDGVKMPAIKRREISAWVKAVAASYDKKVGDIAYIFCNDEKILEVNREYLQHDYYTDIITFDTSDYGFPGGDEDKVSSDIVISVDTVRDNAALYGATFEDELHRVIIHGILHLIGYDDHCEEDIAQMRSKENYYLSLRELV